jgi:2-phospho-L-lactate/phosphoenolpyruvate guanylyltransferase
MDSGPLPIVCGPYESDARLTIRSDNLWAILPLRSLHDGKRRLGDTLSPAARAALVQQLFDRAYRAVHESGCCTRIIVVSPDPALIAWARRYEVLPLLQPDQGLNEGLEYARRAALAAGATGLLIVLPDLPGVTHESIRELVSRGSPGRVVVAADRHGRGTNALLIDPSDALPFAFGDDSLQRHLGLAAARGLLHEAVRVAGMILDVDTAEDLDLAGAVLDMCECAGATVGG